jgi:uncharacterized protein
MSDRAEPTAAAERNTTLDAVRGVAVLGILTMNAVSYGLEPAAYFNVDAGGSDTTVDRIIGATGEIFFDQKFMGLFSMLFGAGIVLFADRAEAKGRRPVLFSLWRNTLLLVIGVVHSLIWDGDILVVYALCAPVLLALRKLSPRTLIVLGTVVVLSSAVLAAVAQHSVDAAGAGIGDGYWYADGRLSDEVGLWLVADFFLRALGMMLIGVALYRTGVITGQRTDAYYHRMARYGLGLGLPLAAAGYVWVAAADFAPEVAVAGSIPNTVATIPVVFGYLAVITLWDATGSTGLHHRVRATGRMALTNYLSQSVLGVVILGTLFDPADLTRTALVVFIVAVWALQLWWSPAWLARFRYGPAEWLWRSGTYRHWQPLRRTTPEPASGTQV